MKALTQDQLNRLSLDELTSTEREWITYMPEKYQDRLDLLVIAELRWKSEKTFNKHTEDFTRRMWSTRSKLGTVGNLTALRFLEAAEVKWKAILLGRATEARLAA